MNKNITGFPQPPVAQKIPHENIYHGQKFVDEYHWLREPDNPLVIDYLEAENAYTEAVMAPLKKWEDTLYQEIIGRIRETDWSVPTKLGDYYYYDRHVAGRQYAIHCRQKGSLTAVEEIVLDENELARDLAYFDLGVLETSPDHRFLAYSHDTNGSESYTLFIKNLETGNHLPERIPNTADVVWANDNRTIFYTVLDETRRPYRLYRHCLGTDPRDDHLVYEEKDGGFYLHVDKTKDDAYVLIHVSSQITSEVRFLRADDPTGDFKLIHPRHYGMEYQVEHHAGQFLILTNDKARNFKLMTTAADTPGKANWQELLPYDDAVKIDDIEPFAAKLVVYSREKGLPTIRIMDYQANNIHSIHFPEPCYDLEHNWNPDYYSPTVRFTYQSFITPRSVFDFDLITCERTLQKEYSVLGHYHRADYETVRLFAPAKDGVEIPISLVYRKGTVQNGANVMYLQGYGSYGLSLDPAFSYSRISLLDRGVICGLAHVRGGSEMGRQWYEHGKLRHKKNTFNDFIACAEYLIAQNWTSPNHLVINGGSAGGLLMGAVTNMRPDLFKAVVADVPFVDVINTMMDESLPLTVVEYDEWGDPRQREFFDYMRSYSPYDNVTAGAYPIMLVTAGLNDPRVAYWEPAKWVAKLRAAKTDTHLLLLKTNMGAGHGGASGRYDRYREAAFEYAFILHMLGIGI